MNKTRSFLERETEIFIEVKRKVMKLSKTLEKEREDIEKLVVRMRNLCNEMIVNKACSKFGRSCSWCKLDRVSDELDWVVDHLKLVCEILDDMADYVLD